MNLEQQYINSHSHPVTLDNQIPVENMDVNVVEPGEPLVNRVPSILIRHCKSLFDRVICAIETTAWKILDGLNCATYFGICTMAVVTLASGMLALPIIVKPLLAGAFGMAYEAVIEAVLRHAATGQLPKDRLPVLLDRLPFEKIPIIRNFITFRWLQHLPFQGEHFEEGKLTYFGSRIVVGAVYGGMLGFFTALINFSPYNILTTGGIAAGIVLTLKVIMCSKVLLDFVFLSNHELNENRLRCKDNVLNRSIRDRLLGNTEASRFIPVECPKNLKGSLHILRINTAIEEVTRQQIIAAAAERCQSANQEFVEESLRNRYISLYQYASKELLNFVKNRDLDTRQERIRQQNRRNQALAQEQADRRLLGLPVEGYPSLEDIDNSHQDTMNLHTRLKSINAHQIDLARDRLRKKHLRRQADNDSQQQARP